MTEKKVIKTEHCSMAAIRYANVLFELGIQEEVMTETREIFGQTPELYRVLNHPVVKKEKKHIIVDRVFPKEIQGFLKVTIDNGRIALIHEVFQAYEEKKCEMAGIVTACLRYVALPSGEQIKQMESFIRKEFDASGVKWDMEEDQTLIGGFILRVNGKEYDYSIQGRLNRLEQKLTRR